MNEAELDALAYDWIERADNRKVWRHMFEVLTLSQGFSLYIVRVTNSDLVGSVIASLKKLASALERRFVGTAVRARRFDGLDPSPVQALLEVPAGPCVVTFKTTGDSWEQINSERVEVALQQINQRRDVLAAQIDGPVFLFVNQDSRQTLIEVAPDLWSIRAEELRVETGEAAGPTREQGCWLSLYELAGLLGLVERFATPLGTSLVSAERPVPAPVELIARERELDELRALSRGLAQRVSIYGLAGSGRRSLAARFVADEGQRWERVVWLDLDVEAQSGAGLYSLLMALRPGLPPPRTREDLLVAYLRATSEQRVLIVVIDTKQRFSRSWPAPSPASLMLIVTDRRPLDEDKSKVRPRSLRQEQIRAIWSRVSNEPLPASFAKADLCRAGLVVAASRSTLPVELELNRQFSPHDDSSFVLGQRLSRELSDEAKQLWGRLTVLPSPVQGLPATLVEDSEQLVFEELLAAGVVARERDGLRVLEDQKFAFIRKDGPLCELLRLSVGEGLTPESADDFQLQLCRAARQGLSDIDLRNRRLVELAGLDELLAAVSLPFELPDMYGELMRIAPEPELGRLHLARLRAELALHRPKHALELLHEVRSAFGSAGLLDTNVERTLDRAAFEIALMLEDRVRLITLLAKDLGFDAAALERFEQLGLKGTRPDSKTQELAGRLATSLMLADPSPELAREASASTSPALRHFGHVCEVLLAMRGHDDAGAREALARVRLSAEQWGAPLALLRADLLEAENDQLAGDRDGALVRLHALSERHETFRAQLSAASVRLFARRTELASEVRAVHRSRELADLCSRRARDCGLSLPDVWRTLAQVYRRLENYERAFEAARRWQRASDDDPEERDRALQFAGDMLEREYRAKREALERGRPIRASLPTPSPSARAWLVWEQRSDETKREHISHLIETREGGGVQVTQAQRPGLFATSREALWELRWSKRELINHPRAEDPEADSLGALPPEIIPLTDALFVSTSTDVLSVESHWAPFDWQNEGVDSVERTFEFIGSMGSLLFVRSEDFIMYQGAMTCFYDSGFKIIDLEQQETMTLDEFLGDVARAHIVEIEGAQAEALFGTDEDYDPDYIGESDEDPGLTMILPTYTEAGVLNLRYQFTRAACRGATDGRWSVYTMSKRATSSYVPGALDAYRRLPPAVLAWRTMQDSPAERWGWSEVYDAHVEWCRALFGKAALSGASGED